jgi:hypothetical protein
MSDHIEPVKLPVPYTGRVPDRVSPPKIIDPFLRYYGFTIHSRPANGPDLIRDGQQWMLDGFVHFQPKAIEYAIHMHRKRQTKAGLDAVTEDAPPAPVKELKRPKKVNKDPFSEGEAGCPSVG